MESESIFYGQADNSGPEDFFLTEGKNLTEFELLDDFVETSPQQFIFAICIAVVAGKPVTSTSGGVQL